MKNKKRRLILVIIIVAILPLLFLCITTLKSANSFNLLEIKGKFSIALPKKLIVQVSENDGSHGVYRSDTIALWYQYGDGKYFFSCETTERLLKEQNPNTQKITTKINGKIAYLYYYDDSKIGFYYNKVLNLYNPSIPVPRFYHGNRVIFFPNTDKNKILAVYINFYDPKDGSIVDKIISSIKTN